MNANVLAVLAALDRLEAAEVAGASPVVLDALRADVARAEDRAAAQLEAFHRMWIDTPQ